MVDGTGYGICDLNMETTHVNVNVPLLICQSRQSIHGPQMIHDENDNFRSETSVGPDPSKCTVESGDDDTLKIN